VVGRGVISTAGNERQWVTRDFRFNIASNPNVARLDVVASLNRFGSASGTVRFDDIEVYSARTYNPENMFINGGAEWLRDLADGRPRVLLRSTETAKALRHKLFQNE
jgi:hypothetical protein